MRTAGLNIRGYSDTGDPVRLNNVQSALAAIRAELIKADKLSKEHHGLRATPNFLKNFAPHLAAFASACDKAKEEWAQRNAAVAATVEIGPQGTLAVNNLIDIIQAQVVRASEASDHARLEILFKYLKTYNTLFDTNEK